MSEPFVVAFVVGVTPGKWARAWSDRMPAAPLLLQSLQQSAAIAALAEGTADVALLRLPVDGDAFSSITLYTEQPVVVASKGHAIEAVDSVTLHDLAEFGILPGDGDTDWPASVELAAANAGVAVMPQSVARAHSRKDVTARPVTDAPETHIALAWPKDRTSPAVDEFIGIVRGRTANSSRGAQPEPVPAPKAAPRPSSKAKQVRPWSKLKPRGKKR